MAKSILSDEQRQAAGELHDLWLATAHQHGTDFGPWLMEQMLADDEGGLDREREEG